MNNADIFSRWKTISTWYLSKFASLPNLPSQTILNYIWHSMFFSSLSEELYRAMAYSHSSWVQASCPSFHCPIQGMVQRWGTNGHTKLAVRNYWIELPPGKLTVWPWNWLFQPRWLAGSMLIYWRVNHFFWPSSQQTRICHKWNKLMLWWFLIHQPSKKSSVGQSSHDSSLPSQIHTHTLETWWHMYTHTYIYTVCIYIYSHNFTYPMIFSRIKQIWKHHDHVMSNSWTFRKIPMAQSPVWSGQSGE